MKFTSSANSYLTVGTLITIKIHIKITVSTIFTTNSICHISILKIMITSMVVNNISNIL